MKVEEGLFYSAERNIIEAMDSISLARDGLNVPPPPDFKYKSEIEGVKTDIYNTSNAMYQLLDREQQVKGMLVELSVIADNGKYINLASKKAAFELNIDTSTPEGAATYIYGLLVDGGITEQGAKAIIANMFFETLGTPLDPTTTQNPGFGLCQWEMPGYGGSGRFNDLKLWCEQNNKNYNDIDGQVAFLLHDLSTNPEYRELYAALTNDSLNTRDDYVRLSTAFCQSYEAPDGDKQLVGETRAYEMLYNYTSIFESVDNSPTSQSAIINQLNTIDINIPNVDSVFSNVNLNSSVDANLDTVEGTINYIYNQCVSNYKYSDTFARAAIANIATESPDFSPFQTEDGNGIGWGLFQWSFGRRDMAEAYCSKFLQDNYGVDLNTADKKQMIDAQLAFLNEELTNEEQKKLSFSNYNDPNNSEYYGYRTLERLESGNYNLDESIEYFRNQFEIGGNESRATNSGTESGEKSRQALAMLDDSLKGQPQAVAVPDIKPAIESTPTLQEPIPAQMPEDAKEPEILPIEPIVPEPTKPKIQPEIKPEIQPEIVQDTQEEIKPDIYPDVKPIETPSVTSDHDSEILRKVRGVLNGEYGNDEDRMIALGDDYEEVQRQVNLNASHGTLDPSNIRIYGENDTTIQPESTASQVPEPTEVIEKPVYRPYEEYKDEIKPTPFTPTWKPPVELLNPNDNNSNLLNKIRGVLNGEYGNDEERMMALGDDYEEVQRQINLNFADGNTTIDKIHIYE